MLGDGAPKKAVEVRKALFKYFIDVRSALKARLPKGLFLANAKSLYKKYCKEQRKQGIKPGKLKFCNRWLKHSCREKANEEISHESWGSKKTNLAKFRTARHTFMKIYRADPENVVVDQMPLHRNTSLQENTLNNLRAEKPLLFSREGYCDDIRSIREVLICKSWVCL